MRNLAHRAVEDEQMDAPDLLAETYRQVLNDLASVNRLTMGARPTLNFIGRALQGRKQFRLLDVGFGQGDMLRAIARWSAKRAIAADLVGIDLNPNSESVARAATDRDLPIRYLTGDYRDHADGFDFIISSLVAHHMPANELEHFLGFMERNARLGWIVNDLHRHRIAYMGFPLIARLMGWHRIVREDGQLSIARSFRPAEWQSYLKQASIGPEAKVVRRLPYRLCVERIR